MIAQAMVWMAATAVLLALAARAAEESLRSYGLATRWVWVVALVASAALPLTAIATDGAFPGGLLPRTAESVDLTALFAAGDAVVVEAPSMEASAARAERIDGVLRIVWPLATLLALLVYAATWLRLARTRRTWSPAQIGGTRVLLSARGGPAVLGLLRPSIVVPAWVRAESAEAQRLILLHESEHLRARDHALLALAPLFAIAMPWNLALWWMLRRLRLAIEVDCDRRVLSHGVSAASYGALLLDIARRGGPAFGAAVALAEPRTFLERRILAMSSSIPKLRLPRAIAFTSVAAGLALAACEATTPMNVDTPAPQQTEPEAVAAAVETPVELLPMKTSDQPLMIIDGVIANRDAADELDLGAIDHIEVFKGAAAAQLYGPRARDGVISIVTRKDAAGAETQIEELAGSVSAILEKRKVEEARVEEMKVRGVPVDDVVLRKREGEVTTAVAEEVAARMVAEARAMEVRLREVAEGREAGVVKLRGQPLSKVEGPRPVMILDGVIVEDAVLDRISPADIERIEVVKGAAAEALYGPRGANGVINIITKKR